MLNRIQSTTLDYIKLHKKEQRKSKGQFFTPLDIARFMGKRAVSEEEKMRILDPGAGNGILAAGIVEQIIDFGKCKSIVVDYIESDPDVLTVLQKTKKAIELECNKAGIHAEINILQKDFISYSTDELYDVVISNPPYKKISKVSDEALKMSKYVYGQPNLYGLFIAKGVEMLKDDGMFLYITPRSWTSGTYYRKVREFFIDNIALRELVLFDSRDKVFNAESVLQETMISIGQKSRHKSKVKIEIVHDNMTGRVTELQVDEIKIEGVGIEKYLLIPQYEEDIASIEYMSKLTDTFASLGYIFKTGPVVEYRNKEIVSGEKKDEYYAPMLRSANIDKNGFVFPAITSKPQYIDGVKGIKMLLENRDTVLVRRLTAKEEARRIQCCIYRKMIGENKISIENHVNYLIKNNGKPLTDAEIEWVYSILTSLEYEAYFRMVSGSTQVNANELNNLPVKRELLR